LADLESPARCELELIRAQEQRVKSSKVREFLPGIGQGDGAEASELANVQGEKKGCLKGHASKPLRQAALLTRLRSRTGTIQPCRVVIADPSAVLVFSGQA
jgi:hypothetical protein